MISGIQKLSLVDYPQHPSFVIFMGKCNLRCPFCHNSSIVYGEDLYKKEYVLSLIKNRKKLIDSVVITGGEPTLHKDFLLSLLCDLKEMDMPVKLDTNGTNPSLLSLIIEKNLVSYVAMDVKNTFEKYADTVGLPTINIGNIKKSIEILETSSISYQFRMTINKTMHSKEDIKEVCSYFKEKDTFCLQPYRFNENQLVHQNFEEFTEQELEEMYGIVENVVPI